MKRSIWVWCAIRQWVKVCNFVTNPWKRLLSFLVGLLTNVSEHFNLTNVSGSMHLFWANPTSSLHLYEVFHMYPIAYDYCNKPFADLYPQVFLITFLIQSISLIRFSIYLSSLWLNWSALFQLLRSEQPRNISTASHRKSKRLEVQVSLCHTIHSQSMYCLWPHRFILLIRIGRMDHSFHSVSQK